MKNRYKARQVEERERIIAERRAARKVKTPGSVPKDDNADDVPDDDQQPAADDDAAEVSDQGSDDDQLGKLEKELSEIPLPEVEPEQPPFRRHK